jgi:hypothetical protein
MSKDEDIQELQAHQEAVEDALAGSLNSSASAPRTQFWPDGMAQN